MSAKNVELNALVGLKEDVHLKARSARRDEEEARTRAKVLEEMVYDISARIEMLKMEPLELK